MDLTGEILEDSLTLLITSQGEGVEHGHREQWRLCGPLVGPAGGNGQD